MSEGTSAEQDQQFVNDRIKNVTYNQVWDEAARTRRRIASSVVEDFMDEAIRQVRDLTAYELGFIEARGLKAGRSIELVRQEVGNRHYEMDKQLLGVAAQLAVAMATVYSAT